MRVKGGTVTHRRHKKVLDAGKGYYDRRSKTCLLYTSDAADDL